VKRPNSRSDHCPRTTRQQAQHSTAIRPAKLCRRARLLSRSRLDDIASLPLLLLLVAVISLVTTPPSLAFTRHVQREADRFGLEITQYNYSAANAFVKLQTDALAVPRPGLLNILWRQTHPPLGDRIDFANDYHPWREGAPLQYGDRFK